MLAGSSDFLWPRRTLTHLRGTLQRADSGRTSGLITRASPRLRYVDMQDDTSRGRKSVLALTTTLTCLDKSLELLWRKSEKAACTQTNTRVCTHTHTHAHVCKQREEPNQTELQFITFPSLKRDNSSLQASASFPSNHLFLPAHIKQRQPHQESHNF